jgi:hypothetical protein
MPAQQWDQTNQTWTSLTTIKDTNVGQHLMGSGTTAPSAAAGTNNGTSPPAPVVAATDNDVRGNITFGSGGSPAAGIQVAVTFAVPFSAAPVVLIVAKNDATQVLGLSVTTTATGFNLVTHSAPTASQANTVYSFDYHVIG